MKTALRYLLFPVLVLIAFIALSRELDTDEDANTPKAAR
jgi:hypothetical protein